MFKNRQVQHSARVYKQYVFSWSFFQQVDVEEVIVHERYLMDSWHNSNDIALIRLSKPAKFSVNVIPVCLPIDKVGVNRHSIYVPLIFFKRNLIIFSGGSSRQSGSR